MGIVGPWLRLTHKLAAQVLLSSLLMITFCPAAWAHEVRPAIADVSLEAERVTIDIVLNAESLIAGIDLQGLQDTNEAPEAAEYDELRALSEAEIAGRFRQAWPKLRYGFLVNAGGQLIDLNIDGVSSVDPGDAELPRDTKIQLSGVLQADGSDVQIGWIAANGAIIVRQAGGGDDAYAGLLDNGTLSEPLPRTGVATEGRMAVFVRYVVAGFDHIIPKGLDHILFVLGLFFLSLQLRPLLWQVTAFTAAHTITLALASLGLVSVSASIVEPLIAASIVYVAVENVFVDKITKWRPLVIFGFGLLHGLGFASVLGEFGLAPGRFIVGLIGFNIGVEIGQLAVIGLAFLAVGLWFGKKPWYRARISIPASLAIAVVGGYWAFERVFL